MTLSAGQICSVQFDRKDVNMNKLLLTSLDSKFYIYDLRTFNSKAGYAHMAESVCAHDAPCTHD